MVYIYDSRMWKIKEHWKSPARNDVVSLIPGNERIYKNQQYYIAGLDKELISCEPAPFKKGVPKKKRKTVCVEISIRIYSIIMHKI